MSMLNIKQNKKAASLLEVLVVLAIISVTIVSAISLVVKSSVSIKINEIEDQANSKLLEALEAAKSFDKVYVSDTSWVGGINNTYYFSLNRSGVVPLLVYASNGVPLTANNCAEPYKITGLNFKMCTQVQVTPRNNTFTGGSNYYEINVVITYDVSGGTLIRNLKTYRYQVFNLAPGGKIGPVGEEM